MRTNVLLILASMLYGQALLGSDPGWALEKVSLSPESEIVRRLSATVSDTSTGRVVSIKGTTPLTTIDDSFIASNKLVVMGRAGHPSAVVIFDLQSGKKIDWFYCGIPKRVAGKWIAYVEFTPTHSSGEFNDVVLLYDVSKSPLDNRIGDARRAVVPAGDFDSPYLAGIPVFPESNARQKSYDNVAASASNSQRVLPSAPFLLLGNRFVFIALQGAEFSTFHDYLVVVDLSYGIRNSSVKTVEIPRQGLRRRGESRNFIKVTKLEPDGADVIRLYVPEAEYGVKSIRVNIAGGPQPVEDLAPQKKHLEIPPETKYTRVSEEIEEANIVNQEQSALTWPGENATVRFEALIGRDGHVAMLLPIGGPPALIPAAEHAVRLRRYRQTVLDGEAIAILTTISVVFKSETKP